MDMDKIFGKQKKQKIDVMDMNRILPKYPNTKPKTGQKIIVHNHYHFDKQSGSMINIPNKVDKRFTLSTLNGSKDMFADDDKDGYPNYMDPAPNNPNIPKKKMIWEKTLQSIYRSDKD